MALGIAKIYVYQFLKVKDKNNTNLFYAAMPLCRYAAMPIIQCHSQFSRVNMRTLPFQLYL